jgi:vacuolar-type H+-ATPase subunit D/Vma8
LQDNKALNIAIEMNDESTKITLQNEIREANERLKLLKTDRDKIKSEIINIENDLQIANKESIQYYYDQENHTPRATI